MKITPNSMAPALDETSRKAIDELYENALISTEPKDYLNWCTNTTDAPTLLGVAAPGDKMNVFTIHANESPNQAITGVKVKGKHTNICDTPRGTMFFKHSLKDAQSLSELFNLMHLGDQASQQVFARSLVKHYIERLKPKSFDPFEL
jgi:hypothetical protein